MGWGGYWDRNETIITERMSESSWNHHIASPKRPTNLAQQIGSKSEKVDKVSNNQGNKTHSQGTRNKNKQIYHVLICTQCGKVYDYSYEKERLCQNQVCPRCAYEGHIRNKEGVA